MDEDISELKIALDKLTAYWESQVKKLDKTRIAYERRQAKCNELLEAITAFQKHLPINILNPPPSKAEPENVTTAINDDSIPIQSKPLKKHGKKGSKVSDEGRRRMSEAAKASWEMRRRKKEEEELPRTSPPVSHYQGNQGNKPRLVKHETDKRGYAKHGTPIASVGELAAVNAKKA